MHQPLLVAANAVYEKEGERIKAMLADRPGWVRSDAGGMLEGEN